MSGSPWNVRPSPRFATTNVLDLTLVITVRPHSIQTDKVLNLRRNRPLRLILGTQPTMRNNSNSSSNITISSSSTSNDNLRVDTDSQQIATLARMRLEPRATRRLEPLVVDMNSTTAGMLSESKIVS
jgi:hypothetical protein